MKIFLVKSIIVFFGIFFLFHVTIGSQLESFKDSLDTFSSKEKRDVLKEKIKRTLFYHHKRLVALEPKHDDVYIVFMV